MPLPARLLLLFMALQHVGFLVLEAFLWQKPVGRRIFRMTEEVARTTATLAANQGLYNGFLAAGLVWAAVADRGDLALFFVVCVLIAGVVGGLTVSRRILVIQALPAALACLALILR